VDLHRHPGHPAGHLRDLRRVRRPSTSAATLAGKLVVTAGCGGMGGAQPLAAPSTAATCLIADVDHTRLERRHRDRYLDHVVYDLDEAIDLARRRPRTVRPLVSIGVHCNAVELLEELLDRGLIPDVLTDQTSAHDPLEGYIPDRPVHPRGGGPAHDRPRALPGTRDRHDGPPRARDGGTPEVRRHHLRLRQQHPPACVRPRLPRRVRLPGVRAGLHPPPVLRGARALPLGGAVGRSAGYLRDRQGVARPVPR
jgi:hypothetical protein